MEKKIRADKRKYHYIYRTTCLINNKFYIGMHSTNNLEDDYIGSGKRLWLSIKKYGIENHRKEILEYLPDRKSLAEREKQIVNEEVINNEMCLNLVLGGFGGFDFNNPKVAKAFLGKKHSEETKQKISKKIKGRKWSDEVKQTLKNSHWSKKYPEKFKEHAKKMAKNALRDGKMSDERKLQISKTMLGKVNRFEQVQCPYCEKTGASNGMKRWHFNNCKFKT